MSRIEQALLRAMEPEETDTFAPEPRSTRPDLRLVAHGVPSAKASKPAVLDNPYVRHTAAPAPRLRAPLVEFELPTKAERVAAPADEMSAAWDMVLAQASALSLRSPVVVPSAPSVIEQASALARVRTPVAAAPVGLAAAPAPAVVVPVVGAELGRTGNQPELGAPERMSARPVSGEASAFAEASAVKSSGPTGRAPKGSFIWIPVQSPTTAGAGIIAHAVASEQFRKLAGQIIRAQETHGVKVVMITSALQGEGKSSTSSSLALTLANSYKRDVLLVDADLRLPSLHTMFQLPGGWGLGELLEQTQSNQVSPYQVSQMLGVVTAGRPNRDPVGALTSARMRDFIEAASAKYDFVIVDTPPVAVLPDANLLGSMVDAVLLVISAGTTQYEYVSRAVEAIRKERILGVVLNRAEQGLTLKAYEYSKY